MRLRNAWAVACVLAAYVATFACIKCDAEAGDLSDVPAAIRYQANISAGGVNPASVALENPHKDDLQSAQTGERLFSAMNCDGCHGGGADEEIFHSIFYGRPKGMPAYGGVLGSEGTWMIITYLKSQPAPNVVPTTSYEDLATTVTPDTNVPTSLVALQPALPATGAEGMLAKYGCVACHTVEKKVVGPAFKDVAAKYRAQTGAAAYLAVQVKNGSAGVWGTIPMPPHSDVPTTDLDAIITWILTAK